MPIPFVLVCAAISLFVLLRQFRSISDAPSRLLMISLWLRWAIAGMHPTTTTPMIAGQSVIALTTLGTLALMMAALPRRERLARHVVPFLPLIALYLASGLYNMEIKGLFTELISWILFMCVLMLTLSSAEKNGFDATMRAIMAASITPVLLQLGTIATGRHVGGELDGTISYIGGYVHEAVISRILLFFMVAALLVRWRNGTIRVAILLYAAFAIFMSNYRTTIIAISPVVLTVLTAWAISIFGARIRIPAIAAVVIGGVVGAALTLPLLPDRYLEIAEVVMNADRLIQPTIEFTAQERTYFSYRLILWARYIELWLQGDPVQFLIGYGPWAWDALFKLSAHSSYVSYLFEVGVLGTAYLIFLLAYNFTYCFGIADVRERATMIALHLGFIVLNLTTVAMKAIEGLMLYALIMAATIALARAGAAARPSARPVPPLARRRIAE